jgi:phage-related tail protein
MEQLTVVRVKPADKDSAARYLASLKAELVQEKAAQEHAQAEV